jgi:nitrate/nitrite-specific signal transduction histidine kinase
MNNYLNQSGPTLIAGAVVGLVLITAGILFTALFPWLIVAGSAILAYSFWKLWVIYVKPVNQLKHWTQMIRAGDFEAQFSEHPKGDYQGIFKELQFIGEMLRSLSRDAESQLQKHTAHIRQKTRSLSILYDVGTELSSACKISVNII